jgi:hypothetical protein
MLEAKLLQDEFVALHCGDKKASSMEFLQREGYMEKLSMKSKRNWKRR